MDWIKERTDSLCKRLRIDKKLLVFIAVGFIGICLLAVSEWIPSDKKDTGNEDTKILTEYSYAEEIEKKLCETVSAISGAGKTKVMVTLENGVESVYAKDEKYEEEKKNSENGGESENSRTRDEQEYILLDNDSGGLVIKVIQPKIRGVAIVCEGGDSVYVQQRITEAVTAVLDINSSRISITKMAEQTE